MSPSRTVVRVACLVEDALARLSASSVCVCVRAAALGTLESFLKLVNAESTQGASPFPA